MSKIVLHNTVEINEEYRNLIKGTDIDFRFLDADQDAMRVYIAEKVRGRKCLLDVGRSMRQEYENLRVDEKQSLDINDFGDYPDIIGDLCQPFPAEYEGKYDTLVALAILEHVYDPFEAVKNIKTLLADDGICFIYVPYMYRYHAPKNLQFQDYYRFSRDALCYMFRDFSEIKLYPLRGKYAAIANYIKLWRVVEKRFGYRVNNLLNKLDSDLKNTTQASGYLVELKK